MVLSPVFTRYAIGVPYHDAAPGTSTGRDAFIDMMDQLRADCMRPPLRRLVRVSGTLRELYPGYPGRLQPLARSTLSETLSMKTGKLPRPELVVSFVLSCQACAYQDRTIPADPGLGTLPGWFAALRAAHRGTALGSYPGLGVPPEPAAPPGRLRCPPCTVQLTPAQRELLHSYGLPGHDLADRLQAGEPGDVFCAALLLGADPDHLTAAQELLLHAATAYHLPATTLLDDTSLAGGPTTEDIARYVCQIADTIRPGDHGEQALYYECAARAGFRPAQIKISVALLAQHGEHRAAAWLAAIAAQASQPTR